MNDEALTVRYGGHCRVVQKYVVDSKTSDYVLRFTSESGALNTSVQLTVRPLTTTTRRGGGAGGGMACGLVTSSRRSAKLLIFQ